MSGQHLSASVLLPLLGVLVLVLGCISLGVGPVPLPILEIPALLLQPFGDTEAHLVLWQLRLPRSLMAILVGAGLATAGTALQGLFRNPLADPALIGISSGGALGAVLFLSLAGGVGAVGTLWWASLGLPLSALSVSLGLSLLLFFLATRSGHTSIAMLLLAGVAVNAFISSVIGFLLHRATDAQLRAITFWTMGSLSGADWRQLAVAGALILPVLVLLPLLGHQLNLLALGEAEALHLGVHVQRLKYMLLLAVAVGAGASVAFTGTIGFVGLAAPHLARLLGGPDHRLLLPLSALVGSTLLLLADLLARWLAQPVELAVGIVTAAVGAPFFLWLLNRQRRSLWA